MVDSGSIARAVHDIDRALQSRGEEELTPVQKQMMMVDFVVSTKELGKTPEELKENTLDNYEGNIIEATRSVMNIGLGRAA